MGDRGFFEESLLNEPHASRDGGRRPIPCRAPWRRFRSAGQAWQKARPFGGSRRGKEPNILGLCGSHPADRATIDAGCPHACEKHAVEGRVPRQARAIAGLPIETKRQDGRHAHEVKGARWRPVDEIGLDRRITSDPGQNRPDGRINFPRMRDPSIVHAAGAARLYRGWLVVAAAFLVAMRTSCKKHDRGVWSGELGRLQAAAFVSLTKALPAPVARTDDAISIYFAGASLASAFVARWCARSEVETAGGVFHTRQDDPAPRVGTGLRRTGPHGPLLTCSPKPRLG
jgi:hypothetical protein